MQEPERRGKQTQAQVQGRALLPLVLEQGPLRLRLRLGLPVKVLALGLVPAPGQLLLVLV